MKTFNFYELGKAVKSKMQYGDSLRSVADEIGVNYLVLRRCLRGEVLTMESTVRILEWLEGEGYQFDHFVK